MRPTAWIAFLVAAPFLPLSGQGVIRLPEPPPMSLPDWLAPFPQADEAIERVSSVEVTSSYTAPAAPAAVIAHYERQMHAAGIAFETKPAGGDASIELSTENTFGVIRIREQNGASAVELSYKRGSPPPRIIQRDLSGTWFFDHADGRFQGTIVLKQSGSQLTGTWHTSQGKSEPDSQVSGRVDGNTISLRRYVGDNQDFVLTLSADGNQLDGFGDGWFLNHTGLDMWRREVPAAPVRAPDQRKKTSHLSFPPPRGTWRWTMQSVAVHRGPEVKYVSYYYEAATDRTVERPLTLPDGADIVGVFPDDCAFQARDEVGHTVMFRGEEDAKAKGLSPGTWSIFPLRCGGVDVFLK